MPAGCSVPGTTAAPLLLYPHHRFQHFEGQRMGFLYIHEELRLNRNNISLVNIKSRVGIEFYPSHRYIRVPVCRSELSWTNLKQSTTKLKPISRGEPSLVILQRALLPLASAGRICRQTSRHHLKMSDNLETLSMAGSTGHLNVVVFHLHGHCPTASQPMSIDLGVIV